VASSSFYRGLRIDSDQCAPRITNSKLRCKKDAPGERRHGLLGEAAQLVLAAEQRQDDVLDVRRFSVGPGSSHNIVFDNTPDCP
jgi:hypothetical protein